MSEPRDDLSPEFDAAWRAHSDEAPPAQVDSAILAAAHRAVGSAPRAADAADARRPWRWWAPLAAAAAIGAIAIGALQLLPDEIDQARSVATDAPPSTPLPSLSRRAEGIGTHAPQPAPAPPEAAMQAPLASGRIDSTGAAQSVPSRSGPEREQATKQRAMIQEEATRDAARTRASTRSAAETAAGAAGTSAAAPGGAGGAAAFSPSDAASNAAAPAPPPPMVMQSMPDLGRNAMSETKRAKSAPFAPAAGPAAAGRAESERPSEPALRAAAPAPQPFPGLAGSLASKPAQSPAPLRKDALGEPAPSSAGADSGIAREQAATSTGEKPQSSESARAKVAARTPTDYIAHIRELRLQSREREAIDELRAFRNAYPDADARLPDDLRAWAAPIPR